MRETLEDSHFGDGPKGNPRANGPSGVRVDRRKRRRALISAPIRVRAADVTLGGPDEISTTLDVSPNGVLFVTFLNTFAPGMEVAVTFPYAKSSQLAQTTRAEQPGRVVRISEMPDHRRSVAIALCVGVGEDIVDAAGRTLIRKQASRQEQETEPPKPLVLVVDADQAIRESIKTCLSSEGYKVIAVSRAAEAHEVLKMFTPALLIAEIEGDDLPGYELCEHCKATPRLRAVPVMLLTRSAYPSDYANAHSLGAMVCMAKPYRQERLSHVVRLLAPTQRHKQQAAPVHPVDPDRCGCGNKKKSLPANASPRERRLWRF
ncbi:MAG TPA: response regulator [Candidatus Acidoferrales bacterium]|nr:response regulator [Candidatus Acidoferrales bacterium]